MGEVEGQHRKHQLESLHLNVSIKRPEFLLNFQFFRGLLCEGALKRGVFAVFDVTFTSYE